jgi:hypothetical protein
MADLDVGIDLGTVSTNLAATLDEAGCVVSRLVVLLAMVVGALPGRVVIRYRGVRRGDVWEPVYEVRYTPPVVPGEPARPDWSYCQPGGSVLVNGMLFAHRPDRRDDDVAAPRHEHAVRQ